jgi:hypothetical protein
MLYASRSYPWHRDTRLHIAPLYNHRAERREQRSGSNNMDMSEKNEMEMKQRIKMKEITRKNGARYPWHRKTRPLGDSTSHWRVYNHRPCEDQEKYRVEGGTMQQ